MSSRVASALSVLDGIEADVASGAPQPDLHLRLRIAGIYPLLDLGPAAPTVEARQCEVGALLGEASS